MNIVYICNEINLKNGWGVVSFHTIRNSLKFFDEVTVITNKKANNVTIDGDATVLLPLMISALFERM